MPRLTEEQLKTNLRDLANQNAPYDDIVGYIKDEGYSPEKYIKLESPINNATDKNTGRDIVDNVLDIKDTDGPLEKKFKGVLKGVKETTDFLSYGAQEGYDWLSNFLGVKPSEHEIPETKTGLQSAAKFAGGLVSPGPGIISGLKPGMLGNQLKAASKVSSLAIRNNLPVADKLYRFGDKILDIAKTTLRKPSEILNDVGKKIASFEVYGFNDDITEHVVEKPSVILKPKQKWEKTYTNAIKFFKDQKNEIGSVIGDFKDKLRSQGKSFYTTVNDLVDEVDMVKKEVATSDPVMNIVKDMEKVILTGKLKDGKSLLKTSRNVLDTINIDDMEIRVKELEPIIQRIHNIVANKKDLTNGQRLALQLFYKAKNKLNGLYDDIDAEAYNSGLLKARGDYSRLKKIEDAFVSLKPNNVVNSFKKAMLLNNEELFRDLKSFFPDDVFNQMYGHIINQGRKNILQLGSAAARPAGQLGLAGEFIAGIIPKTAAVLSSKSPKYSTGVIPEFIYGAKRLLPTTTTFGEISTILKPLESEE